MSRSESSSLECFRKVIWWTTQIHYSTHNEHCAVAFFAFKQGTRRSSRHFSCSRTRGNLFPSCLSLGVTSSCATMVSDKKEDNNDIRWLWCCCNNRKWAQVCLQVNRWRSRSLCRNSTGLTDTTTHLWIGRLLK